FSFSSDFFFSSRRRHTRFSRDWSSDVCSSDLTSAPHPSQPPASGSSRRSSSWFSACGGSTVPKPPRARPVKDTAATRALLLPSRSEERRVGKECRSRWSSEHEKRRDEDYNARD